MLWITQWWPPKLETFFLWITSLNYNTVVNLNENQKITYFLRGRYNSLNKRARRSLSRKEFNFSRQNLININSICPNRLFRLPVSGLVRAD